MTNTDSEKFPVAGSSDNFVEKSTHEEVNLEDSTDGTDHKESSYSRRNFVKQICWFYMNHNYCRYGRNCRFSHVRRASAEVEGNMNSGYEENRVTNPKTGSKARNLKQNCNSKESFNSGSDDVIAQNQAAKVGERIRKRHSDSSAHSDKYRNQYRDSIPRSRYGTSAHLDKHQNQSNVQTSHHPCTTVRQRNLYFYRSINRNAPSDSPKVKTETLNHCRYFSKGFCRQGDKCKFLHQTSDKHDAVGKSNTEAIEESTSENEKSAAGNEKIAAEACTSESKKSASKSCNNMQPQNCHSAPVTRRFMKLQDLNQNDIQRLRDTEIQQLKKRFPAHEIIKSCPEETLHVTFSSSDPDWSFAVNSVSLEITFGKEYPREACTIKVLEADNLPPILIWHLNKSISEWIKEKHQSSVASGKVELLFRPFLRWLDRNLEELFLVGLRKVKQDLLAKEAGIEFVPYEELPGAFPKTAATRGTTEYDDKQDDCHSTSQESGDIDLSEKAEQSTDLKNMKHVQHVDDDSNTVQERAVDSVPELKTDYPPTSAEKENFSPDLLGVKFSSSQESEYPISTNTGCDRFNVPKLGTEVKLLGLELREDAAAMICTKIFVTLQCSRCKTRHEINTPPKRNNTLNCIKCHHSMQIIFHSAMLHQFSAVMGYLHLVECQAVDIPLMECNFTVDCLNCSKQITINGIHYGQQRVTWCLYCNKKMSIYAQSVKFHQLQSAANIVSSGHKLTTAVKRDKKVFREPVIQEGKPLPDCGTCRHYKKSYRWLRFPCCGKAYPCDACHEEKETDHEMKYASRMICGFCAKEQPYAGNKPCISCASNMTKRSGAHWEGGKGCRDKITMSREDRQKYAGMSKTTSRKSQNQKPSKK